MTSVDISAMYILREMYIETHNTGILQYIDASLSWCYKKVVMTSKVMTYLFLMGYFETLMQCVMIKSFSIFESNIIAGKNRANAKYDSMSSYEK